MYRYLEIFGSGQHLQDVPGGGLWNPPPAKGPVHGLAESGVGDMPARQIENTTAKPEEGSLVALVLIVPRQQSRLLPCGRGIDDRQLPNRAPS